MINKFFVDTVRRLHDFQSLSDYFFRQKNNYSILLQTFSDFNSKRQNNGRLESERKFCFLSPREKIKKIIRNAYAHLALLAARLTQASDSWAAKTAKFSTRFSLLLITYF